MKMDAGLVWTADGLCAIEAEMLENLTNIGYNDIIR